MAAASADGVVRLSSIQNPKLSEGWQPLRLTGWFSHLARSAADKRNELMIIYLEDMSGSGLTSADLADGGKAAGKRSEIFDALMGRALKDLTIIR